MKKRMIFLAGMAITTALLLGGCGQISSGDGGDAGDAVDAGAVTSGITAAEEQNSATAESRDNSDENTLHSSDRDSSNTEHDSEKGNPKAEDARTESTGKTEAEPVKKGYPLVIEDMLGNTVTLEKKPERIAVISPKLYNLFLSAGGTSICSVEPEEGGVIDGADVPPSIGQASNPDMIAILELEPHLVFAEAALQNEIISMLQKNEVTVIALKTDNSESLQEAEKMMKEAAGLN